MLSSKIRSTLKRVKANPLNHWIKLWKLYSLLCGYFGFGYVGEFSFLLRNSSGTEWEKRAASISRKCRKAPFHRRDFQMMNHIGNAMTTKFIQHMKMGRNGQLLMVSPWFC